MGITTGEAFCGVVGSKTRKEYTILVSFFVVHAACRPESRIYAGVDYGLEVSIVLVLL